MSDRYVFNGYLFAQRPTGVMRLAKEILMEFDKLPNAKDYCLVIPEYATAVPKLNNINIIRYGTIKGVLWEQTDFVRFIIHNKKVSVNFNNTFPLLKPGIVFIHDIAYKLHPEFGSSLHGKVSNLYHRMVFCMAKYTKNPIITVSHFSKQQIIDFYHIDPFRIHVIGSAWQQMNRIIPSENALEKYDLKDKDFYFSVGSLSKMKNTKWFVDVARKNQNCQFVLAGGKSLATQDNFDFPQNVKVLGFVTDEDIVSLLRSCKAFIYPSIYDGFGLPPLEALSQGAEVICSNAASLTEVYGSSVHYIDPYDCNVDLDKILQSEVCDRALVLNKYSWEKSAIELYNLLEGCKS